MTAAATARRHALPVRAVPMAPRQRSTLDAQHAFAGTPGPDRVRCARLHRLHIVHPNRA